MAVEDTVGEIVGIVETVANSVAICEIVLMRMIVADRRSARTPILARNSVFVANPAIAARDHWRNRAATIGLHLALTQWAYLSRVSSFCTRDMRFAWP